MHKPASFAAFSSPKPQDSKVLTVIMIRGHCWEQGQQFLQIQKDQVKKFGLNPEKWLLGQVRRTLCAVHAVADMLRSGFRIYLC